MTVWPVVLVVGVATVIFKASGPVLLGRRPLPAPLAGVVVLLGPVLLAALVVTQTVGGDGRIVLDARLAGVGAAALATDHARERELGAGKVDRRDREVDLRVLDHFLDRQAVHEHVEHRALDRVRVQALTHRQVPLRVEVD